MTRSTKRHITRTDVSTSEIKDVFDSDIQSRPLSIKNRKASDFFTDGDVTNSIYENFIDPDNNGYCPPGEGGTKKETMTAGHDLAWGYWRNYGGEEFEDENTGEILCEIPEIYFSTILDNDGNERVPQVTEATRQFTTGPQDGSFVTELDLGAKVPIIPVFPKINESYFSEQVKSQQNLVSLEQCILFREGDANTLNNSTLSLKIGFDYDRLKDACCIPEFRVKITPYIQDYTIERRFEQEFIYYDLDYFVGLIGGEIINKTITDLTTSGNFGWFGDTWNYIKGTGKLKMFIEGFIEAEPFNAIQILIKDLPYIKWSPPDPVTGYRHISGVWDKDQKIWRDDPGGSWEGYLRNTYDHPELSSDPDATLLGDMSGDFDLTYGAVESTYKDLQMLMQEAGGLLKILYFAKAVYGFLNPELVVENATYQYYNRIKGMYKYDDIKESSYKIGFGSKGYFTNGSYESQIELFGNYSPSYDADSFNAGSLFDVTNPFGNFPNSNNIRENYMNMQFFPDCIQYDYNTPPPTIGFLVELEPIRCCTLSTTKITAFKVEVAPDKYKFPRFALETSNYDSEGYPILHTNTSIRFVNARFADMIFMADLDPDDFFDQHYNCCFNSDGNLTRYKKTAFFGYPTNFYTGFDGNDLVLVPSQLINEEKDPSDPNNGFLAETSWFQPYFLQEKNPGILYNPTFRVEAKDDPIYRFGGLWQNWHYTSGLDLRNGAIYKDHSTGISQSLYQDITDRIRFLPRLSISLGNFYKVKIRLVVEAGRCALGGSWWNGFIYSRHAFRTSTVTINSNTFERLPLLDHELLDSYYGIVPDVDWGLAFTKSIDDVFFVKALPYEDVQFEFVNKVLFRVYFSTDFIGRLEEIQIQHIPNGSVGVPTGAGVNLLGMNVNLWSSDNGRMARNAIAYANQKELPKVHYFYGVNTLRTIYVYYWSQNSPVGENYSVSMEIPVYYSVEIGVKVDGIKDLIISEWSHTTDTSWILNFDHLFTGRKVQYFKIEFTNNFNGLDETDPIYTNTLISFTCNDIKMCGIRDLSGMLLNCNIDISNTNFGHYKQGTAVQKGRRTVIVGSEGSEYGSLYNFRVSVGDLDISNTPIEENIDALQEFYHTNEPGETKSLVPITTSLDFSNTSITGSLITILNTPTIVVVNTNISIYGFGQPNYPLGTTPSITWHSSKTQISVGELNYLVKVLVETNTQNGYLDISGTNPDITDFTALDNIATLVSRGWNVLYNSAESDWTYEGVMTFVYAEEVEAYIYEDYFGIIQGTADPELSFPFEGIIFQFIFYENEISIYAKYDEELENMFTDEEITIKVNDAEYILPYDEEEGKYRLAVSDYVVSDGGEYNIKLRYTSVEPEWTYEGVMTVGYEYDDEEDEYTIGYGYFTEFPEYALGSLSPTWTIEGATEYGIQYETYDNTIMVWAYNETTVLDPTATLVLKINDLQYDIPYINGRYRLEQSTNPFPPVGQICEIKLRYTLAPEPTFPEVTIGTQTWMAKNLDIDDGLGGIYAYDDNEDNVPIYGRLYTWDAAVRVAASVDGWHLPSDAEWTTLTTYLGVPNIAGGKLKETGTDHWTTPNTGATNESGFTALPGGGRGPDGTFDYVGYYGYWWSATEDDTFYAWYRVMNYDFSNVYRDNFSKELGFSVRLIKD